MERHFAARANATTVAIRALARRDYKAWLERQPAATASWLKVTQFEPTDGNVGLLPARDGSLAQVVLGLGTRGDLWSFAALPGRLPRGRYRLDGLDPTAAEAACLGFALGCYRYDRYKKSHRPRPTLVWPSGVDQAGVLQAAEAIAFGRDLVTTPANDMGPEHLAAAAEELAGRHGAQCKVIVGDALLEHDYPAIHAVGRASSREPRLVDLVWGSPRHPKLTLVGKGVCFDSGGLDLKTAAGMKLMKKDMGGAASVLALASMIMAARLPVRLRVLVPAVENSVSGDAYRPLDVIQTRKGLTVEIGNTDAEGRVILGDALTEADRQDPDLIIDFATLTGAARVALGTELPALFCDDDAIASRILDAGDRIADPMWRMPLFSAYRRHLDSRVADLNNMSGIAEGGAITAALYLKEFVSPRRRWVHIDTMAWNSNSRPGRPVGGDVQGVRACFAMIRERYGKRS
jgi:leucyl aminopeptidase